MCGGGILRACAHSCSEIMDFLNCVLREHDLSETAQVEPLVGGLLQRSVIEIETVDVNIRERQADHLSRNCLRGKVQMSVRKMI